MALAEQKTRARRDGRRFDPTPGKVRYSRRWLGATAAGGVLASLAVSTGGLPAALALGAAGAAGAAYALLHEPRTPRLERLTLRFADLPPSLDGLRIGQISDMHLGMRYAAENSRWAVRQMIGEAPDLLAFTGDFVSYEHAIGDLAEVLADLPRPPLGAYAVPGNHDYWEGIDEIRRALAAVGVEFLINEHRVLGSGGGPLAVAGIDDQWDGVPDLDLALAGAPRGAFKLLLSHCPDVADEAAGHGVQMQLSGHTHGGHLCLPGLGSFCLPRYGWRYPVGHEHVGALQLYVSRGIGGLPLRLGCAPEAAILTLRRA